MKPAIYDVITLHLSNTEINPFGYFQGKQKSLQFDGYLAYSKQSETKNDLSIYKNETIYELKELYCDNVQQNPLLILMSLWLLKN